MTHCRFASAHRSRCPRAVALPGVRGFSLVELLIVILVISVLAAMLLPSIERAAQAAWRTACANNMRQQCLIIQQYADMNGGKIPSYSLSHDYFLSGGAGSEYGAWAPILALAFGTDDRWFPVFACPADTRSISQLTTTIFRNAGAGTYSYSAPIQWVAGLTQKTWYAPASSTYIKGHPNHYLLTNVNKIQIPAKTAFLFDSDGDSYNDYQARILALVPAALPAAITTTYGWRHNYGRNQSFFDGHVGYYPFFENPWIENIWTVTK